MIRLFDVSALVAMVDPTHPFHSAVHAWLQRHPGATWATCPLTENGFVRITSQPGFKGPKQTSAEAIKMLRSLKESPSWTHVFWPDDYSITQSSSIAGHLIAGPGQITDIYLAALAFRKGGRLLTFDRRIAWQCIPGATAELLEIPSA